MTTLRPQTLIALALACAAAAWVVLRPAPPPPAPAYDMPKVAVPSGQEVYFSDVVQNEPGTSGLVYRFRFIAPAIARDTGTVSQETAAADMQALCDSFALARISGIGPQPSQVIISLSDRPVAFGEAAPEATQFFEAYRPENGKCVWELF